MRQLTPIASSAMGGRGERGPECVRLSAHRFAGRVGPRRQDSQASLPERSSEEAEAFRLSVDEIQRKAKLRV
jgi:hypothetical protein